MRDEKVKVIEALGQVAQSQIVRDQYRAQNGAKDSYRDHAADPESMTESFVAMKVAIENWRWAGTPFYLRTGKKLRARTSEIALVFRDPPHMIFPKADGQRGNALIIRLQPNEGITLRTTIKDPGPGGMRLTEVSLDMTFSKALGPSAEPQDAYERLIMDVTRANLQAGKTVLVTGASGGVGSSTIVPASDILFFSKSQIADVGLSDAAAIRACFAKSSRIAGVISNFLHCIWLGCAICEHKVSVLLP